MGAKRGWTVLLLALACLAPSVRAQGSTNRSITPAAFFEMQNKLYGHQMSKSFMGEDNLPPLSCGTVGDPHWSTFAGVRYDFYSTGEYMLVKSPKANQYIGVIIVNNPPVGHHHGLAVKYDHDIITLRMETPHDPNSGPTLRYNDQVFTPPEGTSELHHGPFHVTFANLAPGMTSGSIRYKVKPTEAFVDVNWGGFHMNTKYLDIVVTLPGSFAGDAFGQCGAMHNNPPNVACHTCEAVAQNADCPGSAPTWIIPGCAASKSLFEADPVPPPPPPPAPEPPLTPTRITSKEELIADAKKRCTEVGLADDNACLVEMLVNQHGRKDIADELAAAEREKAIALKEQASMPGKSLTWGASHMTTVTGQNYQWYATGEYIWADSPGHSQRVHIIQEADAPVGFTTGIAVRVNQDIFTVRLFQPHDPSDEPVFSYNCKRQDLPPGDSSLGPFTLKHQKPGTAAQPGELVIEVAGSKSSLTVGYNRRLLNTNFLDLIYVVPPEFKKDYFGLAGVFGEQGFVCTARGQNLGSSHGASFLEKTMRALPSFLEMSSRAGLTARQRLTARTRVLSAIQARVRTDDNRQQCEAAANSWLVTNQEESLWFCKAEPPPPTQPPGPPPEPIKEPAQVASAVAQVESSSHSQSSIHSQSASGQSAEVASAKQLCAGVRDSEKKACEVDVVLVGPDQAPKVLEQIKGVEEDSKKATEKTQEAVKQELPREIPQPPKVQDNTVPDNAKPVEVPQSISQASVHSDSKSERSERSHSSSSSVQNGFGISSSLSSLSHSGSSSGSSFGSSSHSGSSFGSGSSSHSGSSFGSGSSSGSSFGSGSGSSSHSGSSWHGWGSSSSGSGSGSGSGSNWWSSSSGSGSGSSGFGSGSGSGSYQSQSAGFNSASNPSMSANMQSNNDHNWIIPDPLPSTGRGDYGSGNGGNDMGIRIGGAPVSCTDSSCWKWPNPDDLLGSSSVQL